MVNRRWIWMLAALGLSACEQRPGITPRIDSVTPAVVAVGQERFVVLSGRFAPRVSWTPGEEPSLSADFDVQFGDFPSDRVRLDSAERLVARVPAIAQAGCLDVTVSGPGRTLGRLEDGLCVREVESVELVLGCLVGQALPGLCSFDDATDSLSLIHTDLVWSTTPTIPMGLINMYHRAYAFSPHGRRLLFMREVLDEPALGDASWRQRKLMLRDMDAGWETILAEARQPPSAGPEEQSGFEAIAESAFSPDGRWIAYVEDMARLVIRQVPAGPQSIPEPEVVVDWTDQPGIQVGHPDFDPAATKVLFTRAEVERESGIPRALDLFIAPVDGSQPARDLFPDAPADQWNGPGSFHPDGSGVVFVSSRLNMEVASPFLLMLPVTNLYRLELASGQVTALTVPTAGVFASAPVISPDGRLAANTGFVDEVAGRTLDVLLTDLDTGRTHRLGPDRGPFCYPDALGQECDAGTLAGCCYYAEGGQPECCDLDHPEFCPTFDLLPAFSPDSQALVANYMPWMWWCYGDGDTPPDWTLGFIQFGIFLGVPLYDPAGTWVEIPIPTDDLGQDFGAFGPVFRQTLVGE